MVMTVSNHAPTSSPSATPVKHDASPPRLGAASGMDPLPPKLMGMIAAGLSVTDLGQLRSVSGEWKEVCALPASLQRLGYADSELHLPPNPPTHLPQRSI